MCTHYHRKLGRVSLMKTKRKSISQKEFKFYKKENAHARACAHTKIALLYSGIILEQSATAFMILGSSYLIPLPECSYKQKRYIEEFLQTKRRNLSTVVISMEDFSDELHFLASPVQTFTSKTAK